MSKKSSTDRFVNSDRFKSVLWDTGRQARPLEPGEVYVLSREHDPQPWEDYSHVDSVWSDLEVMKKYIAREYFQEPLTVFTFCITQLSTRRIRYDSSTE